MTDPKLRTADRREFLGAAAVAAGITILKPKLVFGTQANSAVRLGLLGCGPALLCWRRAFSSFLRMRWRLSEDR